MNPETKTLLVVDDDPTVRESMEGGNLRPILEAIRQLLEGTP